MRPRDPGDVTVRDRSAGPAADGRVGRPPLTSLSDDALVRRSRRPGRRGDEARAEVVARYQPLVLARAGRFARSGGRRMDDLVGAGQEGLLKAVRDFDLDRGVPFAAYATAKVHGELMRWLRDTRYAVHVPRTLHERAMQVRRAAAEREAATGTPPRPAEIAVHLDTTVEEVLEALAVSSAERARRAVLVDSIAPTVDDEVGDVDLAAAVGSLPERAQRILHARYVAGASQSEAGRLVGLSQPQVSREERRALSTLRAALAPGRGSERRPTG